MSGNFTAAWMYFDHACGDSRAGVAHGRGEVGAPGWVSGECHFYRGVLLEYGLGTKQDPAGALREYDAAGSAGHAAAILHAGLIRLQGRG